MPFPLKKNPTLWAQVLPTPMQKKHWLQRFIQAADHEIFFVWFSTLIFIPAMIIS